MLTKHRRWKRLGILVLLGGLVWLVGSRIYDHYRHSRTAADPANGFLIAPYLQLGDAPKQWATETAEVLWHTFEDADALPWRVESRVEGTERWVAAVDSTYRRVAMPGVVPHRVHRAKLVDLKAGELFEYRVARGGELRFQAQGKARPAPGRPYRAVVYGDLGTGSPAEARVVNRVYEAKPDVVMLAGDLVYWRGRIFEYERRFFPFYNADKPDPAVGAPLLRSTLVLAGPGNHDLMARDLDDDPDAQAYFYYWSMPLNGPVVREDAPGSPALKGSADHLARFREAAGPAYPRMANYSVDVGDVHWTFLDLNPYVDWSDPALLAWLDSDLAEAKEKPWRFVVGHHPGFQSGKAHWHEKQMRQLAPIFERRGVSIVFAGHVHNYQRSRPLTFVPRRRPNGKFADDVGEVDGEIAIDRDYDGVENTRPRGVIYLVTGGGGAALHDTERSDQVVNVNDFTVKFVADRHSVTQVDIGSEALDLRQIGEGGEILDEFRVTRAADRASGAVGP